MASITITIPDANLADTVDGICDVFNYQATIGNPPVANTETKNQFAKRMTAQWIKNHYRNWMVKQAATATIATANSNVDAVAIT